MKNVSALFLLFLLFACSGEKKHDYDYIIKKIDPKFYPIFYGQHNFILIDSNKVYYHDKYVFHGCGTGIDGTKPARLDLYPDTLKEIKLSALNKYLKSLKYTPTSPGGFHFASISSQTDTIRNKAFVVLTNFFKKIKYRYSIRKCTEEEEFVSIAKNENKAYEPYKIKWKVGFDQEIPSLEEIIKFLPPKVEK